MLRIGTAILVAAGMVLALPAGPAQAAPELSPVMVVLDASGSMQGDKMASAKTAVQTLVQRAPAGARLGLTVYGTGTGSSDAEKDAGCRDVKIVQPVGALDKARMTGIVDGLEPSGYTPIGESLRKAAAGLPADGARSIVLVSDGEDTCAPPDPCEVARELAKKGIDLRIHTIGFDVDGKARKQLNCVADVTGGTYTDAPDAGTLAGALNRVTQQALRDYKPVGRPIAGSREVTGAPVVTAGAYQDRIELNGGRYYAIDVPAGYTLLGSATYIAPHITSVVSALMEVTDTAGTSCATSPSTVRDDRQPVVTATLTWTAPAAKGSTPCEQPGPKLVHVAMDRAGGGDDADAVTELQFGLEPPLAGDAGPAPTQDAAVKFEAPSGTARELTGGGSFGTAATIDGSGKYTDTIVQGEMVFYRVKLGWGQGMAFRATLARQDVGNNNGFLSVFSYTPQRAQITKDSAAYTGDEEVIPSNADAVATPPVLYRNRELNGAQQNVDTAGWFYLGVLSERARGAAEPFAVPYTLEVSVSGTAGSGPALAGGAGATFGDQGVVAAKPSMFRKVADAGPLVWIGAAVLLVLLVVVLALLLAGRRRRRSPPSMPQQYPPAPGFVPGHPSNHAGQRR